MADSKFLTGRAIQREVRCILAMSGEAVVAVAFWGDTGAELTGVTARRSGTTRVLCDLFSGACNPAEISLLLASKIPVRTTDGMHAKVWCVGDFAIVGSANASANGLGFEGKEVSGNVEAAVLVHDAAFALKVRNWFDGLWGSDAAKRVGKAEVEDARLLWERRNSSRHRQNTETVLAAITAPRAASRFKKVKVIAYVPGEHTPGVEETFAKKGRAAYGKQELAQYDEAEVLPIYECDAKWLPQPGDVFVDFHINGKKQRLSYEGLWRVRNEKRIPISSDQHPGTGIVLLERLTDIDGARLPKTEARTIAAKLKSYAAARCKSLEDIEVSLLDLYRSQH